MSVDATISRREALKVSCAALLPVVSGQDQKQDPAVGRLRDPRMAGRPRDRISDYENDAFVVGIEEKLRCTCGCNLDVYTCRTTDFTCATSPAMHREVVALIERGMTGQEVIDAFVEQYGELVLMAPKKEGFNIVGYVVPGIAITAVGALMLWMLSRRDTIVTAQPGDVGGSPYEGMSEEDAERLEAELADLEQ
ncbi:MAG: cytochrome c-type biogenesis protein CcmH [Gemmatimonadales bacterium]